MEPQVLPKPKPSDAVRKENNQKFEKKALIALQAQRGGLFDRDDTIEYLDRFRKEFNIPDDDARSIVSNVYTRFNKGYKGPTEKEKETAEAIRTQEEEDRIDESFRESLGRPQGRMSLQEGTVPLGPRDKIKQLGVGDEILEMYKQGAGTIEIGQKYNISKDTVNRFIKQTNPKLLRESLPKVNQYNFDYSILDDIREDAKTMSRKEILEKYKGKISKKRLDKEKLTFGKVEESGRPRVPPGQRSPKQVKRANRIRNAQGFDVSGTAAKNFHHIFPIGGLVDFSAQDVMILDKKYNEILGGFNLQLNDIADEIGSLDLSNPNAVIKLNDLNAKSKDLVDRAKAKLPTDIAKSAIGYVEYQPVFDENGTIIELQQIRKGVDKNPSILAEFGNKKFKDYTTEEKRDFRNKVKEVSLNAEKQGLTISANPFFDPKVVGQGALDVLKVLGTPTSAAGFAGLSVMENLKEGESLPRAVLDKEVGIELLFPELAKRTVGKAVSGGSGILSQIGRVAANPFFKAARAFTPAGAVITAAGLTKDAYDRIKELEAMDEDEREALRQERDAFSFDASVAGAADGGLMRIGFADGPDDPRRRTFMKIVGGLASLPIIGRFFDVAKLSKPAIEKAAESGVPTYFFDLVNKIKRLGDETGEALSDPRVERTYRYKNYELREGAFGDPNETMITREIDMGPYGYKEESMRFKKGGPDEDGNFISDEYEEVTASPDMEGKLKDVEDGIEEDSITEIMEEAGEKTTKID